MPLILAMVMSLSLFQLPSFPVANRILPVGLTASGHDAFDQMPRCWRCRMGEGGNGAARSLKGPVPNSDPTRRGIPQTVVVKMDRRDPDS
jgi:hypothetical protein